MEKKILITGVTGMVGSHLLDYILANTNDKVFGGCRWRSPLDNVKHHLSVANEKNRLEFVEFDLIDLSSIQRVIRNTRPDIIFHLAAESFPNYSFSAPSATYQTNILGTHNLLESVREYSPDSIIHICSSSEVFGKVTSDKLPIKENCNFHPASPYAISKIGTDYLGQFFAEAYNLNTVITRMFTHTGPRRGDVFAESTFAKQIALIERGVVSPIVKVGNLNSLRTWADVRDAVRAYHLLVNSDFEKGGAYNIGGTFSCTVEEMLNFLISESTVKNISIEQEDTRVRPIDADLQVPDVTKFISLTGWQPEYSFYDTMRDLLNYWRERSSSLKDELIR